VEFDYDWIAEYSLSMIGESNNYSYKCVLMKNCSEQYIPSEWSKIFTGQPSLSMRKDFDKIDAYVQRSHEEVVALYNKFKRMYWQDKIAFYEKFTSSCMRTTFGVIVLC